MKLKTIKYNDYESNLPQTGKHIVGQEEGENIIIYQAFNPKIADYAVKNQVFGGDYYKFSRMTWIKPNFLWMMYRAGWAMKEHQQKILAITIPKVKFEEILKQAVHSKFEEDLYETQENWRFQLSNSEVRLQWDPDHDPYGNKHTRKAIQLGLKGKILKNFAQDWIVGIEDITPFAHEQKKLLNAKMLDTFSVIEEKVIEIEDPIIKKNINLS
ncbi:MAG: DUF4291 domain-containing protein [Polaribacter sp.]|uniref:DUF4291 domain-containing protein n=1 Tax=Polaribacter sp. TaxID=1920175 RepID=UPI003264E78F